jgi:hypothetical protein
MITGDVQRVYEYKSFDLDPMIGGIYTRTKFHNLELNPTSRDRTRTSILFLSC